MCQYYGIFSEKEKHLYFSLNQKARFSKESRCLEIRDLGAILPEFYGTHGRQ